MLGLDAADIRFIRESLDSLPTLRRLLDEGASFPLESTAAYLAASVWPTFYTGKGPGEHGVCQHIQWDPQRMRMRRLSRDWFHCEPFWYDLEREGRNVCAVDVPFTFESRLERGVEIVNWGSHDLMGPYAATPPRLGRELRHRFGRHPMGYEIPVNKTRKQLQTLHQELLEGARRKGRLLSWLLREVEWDFFVGVFGECHRGGHIFWPAPDDADPLVPPGALLEVYREVDASVGLALESVAREETTVIVFSLHGMRPNFTQEHFMRRLMDRVNAGFEARLRGERGWAPEEPTPRGGLVRKLRESIPASLQYAVARNVPVGVRDWVVGREVTGGVDWRRTRGIAQRSDLHSFVRFNLAGRERDGLLVAGSEEHRDYEKWVKECFLGLKDRRTGAPIVKDVIPAQDVLLGSRSELLPDLIVRWAEQDPATEIHSEELGGLHGEPETGRGGEHRAEGFAVVLGPERGALPPLAHNGDFAGFVRHLLGASRG